MHNVNVSCKIKLHQHFEIYDIFFDYVLVCEDLICIHIYIKYIYIYISIHIYIRIHIHVYLHAYIETRYMINSDEGFRIAKSPSFTAFTDDH